MEKLYEHTLQRQLEEQSNRTAQLEQELADMRLCMQNLQLATSHAPAAQCAGSPQQQAQQIYNGPVAVTHITINQFGKERTPHIDRPTVKALLDGVLAVTSDPSQGALSAFLKTAMMIYSDPTHPENLTCYLPNSKKDDVLVHGEDGWEVQPYTLVLPPMATKSIDALFNNQPFEDAAKYGDLMIALRDNEEAYKSGGKMKTVLVRNKTLLEHALGVLPS